MDPENTQPPFVDPNTVVPDGTPTYVAPADDSRAAEVGEKTGAQENWINPNEVNTMGTNAVKMGGKAWVWWTVAGVITTLVILLAGSYYFFKVRGTNSTNVTAVESSKVAPVTSMTNDSYMTIVKGIVNNSPYGPQIGYSNGFKNKYASNYNGAGFAGISTMQILDGPINVEPTGGNIGELVKYLDIKSYSSRILDSTISSLNGSVSAEDKADAIILGKVATAQFEADKALNDTEFAKAVIYRGGLIKYGLTEAENNYSFLIMRNGLLAINQLDPNYLTANVKLYNSANSTDTDKAALKNVSASTIKVSLEADKYTEGGWKASYTSDESNWGILKSGFIISFPRSVGIKKGENGKFRIESFLP